MNMTASWWYITIATIVSILTTIKHINFRNDKLKTPPMHVLSLLII